MIIIIPIYLFIYLYVIVFDLYPIKKNQHNIIYYVNLVTIAISFLIVVLVGLNLNVPSPSNLIQYIVELFVN